jgi:Helicase associated domain
LLISWKAFTVNIVFQFRSDYLPGIIHKRNQRASIMPFSPNDTLSLPWERRKSGFSSLGLGISRRDSVSSRRSSILSVSLFDFPLTPGGRNDISGNGFADFSNSAQDPFAPLSLSEPLTLSPPITSRRLRGGQPPAGSSYPVDRLLGDRSESSGVISIPSIVSTGSSYHNNNPCPIYSTSYQHNLNMNNYNNFMSSASSMASAVGSMNMAMCMSMSMNNSMNNSSMRSTESLPSPPGMANAMHHYQRHNPITPTFNNFTGNKQRLNSTALSSVAPPLKSLDESTRHHRNHHAPSPIPPASKKRNHDEDDDGDNDDDDDDDDDDYNEPKSKKGTPKPNSAISGSFDDDDDDDDDDDANNQNRFKPFHEEKWVVRYKELLGFHREHGHAAVPHTFPPNPQLARWVKRQRRQYKLRKDNRQSTMTGERLDMLNNVGFIWDSHDVNWREKLMSLSSFSKENGNCNVPSNYRDKKLATWVKCQRRQYKLYWDGKPSAMSPDRMMELEKIGFEWEIRSTVPRKGGGSGSLKRKSPPAATGPPVQSPPPSPLRVQSTMPQLDLHQPHHDFANESGRYDLSNGNIFEL